MPITFEDLYRRVHSLAPALDVFVVRQQVQNAYEKLCSARRWSWLRCEGVITFSAPRSGTADVTLASETVVPGALTFSSADVGRQFRVGSTGHPSTIIAVDSLGRAVISPAYGGLTTAGAACQIFDAFAVMPQDFGYFLVIGDETRQVIVRHGIAVEELNAIDPARVSTGDPWGVADLGVIQPNLGSALSPDSTLDGRAVYECYPYKTTTGALRWFGVRRPEQLQESSIFRSTLGNHTSVLEELALIQIMELPAIGTARNSMFSLAAASQKRGALMGQYGPWHMLELADEGVFQSWWSAHPYRHWRYAPITSAYLQATDWAVGEQLTGVGLAFNPASTGIWG